MGAIKRTPADEAFSKCIRALAGWRCERCQTYYPEGRRGALDCSHFYGRGKWGTRFHPDNASSLCYGCHSYMGAHPAEHEAWFRARIGEGRYQLLVEAVNDTWRGREYRRTKGKGEIAKHYREQFALIEAGQNYLVEWL